LDSNIFASYKNKSYIDLRTLIEKNFPDVNIKDEEGYPLILLAVDNSDIRIIEILISMGSNVNSKDNSGITPLHLAVYNRNIDIIDILIANKANIEACENHGYTPFHLAIMCGNIEAAKTLVSKGVNIYAKSNSGKTPLFLAKQKADEAMIQYLASIPVLDESFIDILKMIVNKYGKGPLLDLEICKAFVADYAKRNYREESLCLFEAVEAGVSKALLGSSFENEASCMEQQQEKLQNNIGMKPATSIYIVNILAQILWDGHVPL